jgi:adenosylmethionine-8-amino-7-oxononanoate aminotransferase
LIDSKEKSSNIAPQFGNRTKTFTVLGGEGLNIFTKEYGTLFDTVAGYWYNILGMKNSELAEVKRDVGGIATHLYEEYTNPFAEKLATLLCNKTSMPQLVFSATGSMANENARKEAVNYHKSKGKKEDELVFVTIKGSYHGSVGEMLKWIDPQKNPYTIDAPIYEKKYKSHEIVDDFAAKIELARSNGKTIAGFFFEPIMGVRGSVPLPEDYINGIGEICEKNDILLIADEVTTGIGRAGKFCFSNSFKFKPDIICFGKALTAGHYPCAITLFNQKIIDGWRKLEETIEYSKIHRRGNSITGTQEACALGLKVLEILDRDNLIEQVKKRGMYALEKLEKIRKFSSVREIRGTGLLIGIDVTDAKFAKNIITPEMRKRGINILPEGRVIMFNPAYIVSEEQIDYFVNSLEEILSSINGGYE